MVRAAIAVTVAALTVSVAIAQTALGNTTMAPTLKGTVGPGFTITLTKGGTKVKELSAGSYTFVVSDKASIHNFTLEQEKGGKFDKHLTSTPFQGTKTVKVMLTKGEWKFYCSVHDQMHGTFDVK
jgi:plastocyanin